MKSIIIIVMTLFFLIPFSINDVFAEIWYYYVDPLPTWASSASNIMDKATYAWESVNPDLEFIEVTTPEQANFSVQWVKEFGVEHVGYAYGSWFIEVGLGDSNCGDGKTWQPYSENYVTDIMTHEIGHVLGWDHVDDPNSIMYPTAINWEYGRVEESTTLTNGYGYFLPVCTVKDVTTFDWSVVSDDTTYGFDVFFVPSSNEFDNWIAGESFSYFQDDGCSANNMLSVSGTCEGVTSDSGLLVIMGDTVTNPLTQISINYQEHSSRTNILSNTSKEQTKSQPVPTPVPSDDANTIFSLFVDPQEQFSIKYPSTWIVNDEKIQDFQVGFVDNYDWTSQIFVMYSKDVDYTGFTEDNIFNNVITLEQEFCNNATFDVTGYICYDFEMVTTDTTILESNEFVYFYMFTDTRQYNSVLGVEYPTATILMEIHDGNNVWSVYSETDSNLADAYVYSITTSLNSFEVLQTSDAPSTTNIVDPIPIPTSSIESNIFSNIGTVTLDKNYVELTYAGTEQIKIYGNIIDSKKGERVHITYTYPDGTTNGDLVFTTSSGAFETFLILDNVSPRGIYDILVTAKNKIVRNLELTVTDKVHDPQTTLESSQDLNVKPESITVPDQSLDDLNSIAPFVDESKDPQSYVDRYNTEPTYKEWFHENYPQYNSIEQAIGLELIQKIPDWVKNIFGWYAQDQVSEDELLDAIKYLINERILIVN